MSDLAQKNSMSPTQKNPATAYAHLFSGKPLDHLQYILKPSSNSSEPTWKNQTHDSYSPFRYASEHKNDSSTCSSQGNELCDVKSDTESQNLNFAGEESKDPEKPQEYRQPEPVNENLHRYEPQTPALHTNPFKSKGSIMQKAELFAATQPSSINQRLDSPTSSRPSPEAYNEFSSPVKRRRLTISPLSTYKLEGQEKNFSRNLLVNSFSEENQTPLTDVFSVQSLDSITLKTKSSSVYKLRPYASFKEDQNINPGENKLSLLENSDSSPESTPNTPINKKEQRVQEQSPVLEFPKTHVCRNLEPFESSTIRKGLAKNRQTIHAESDSQCKEFNSQEKQITNYGSHSHHDSIDENYLWDQIPPGTERPVNLADNESRGNNISAQEIGTQDFTPLFSSVGNSESKLPKLNPERKEDTTCTGKISQTQSPQEVHQIISSRIIAKRGYLHSDYLEKVPETSPIVHQLPRVHETTVNSSQENVETVIEKLPNSTSDPDFENTMRIDSSPNHRKRRIPNKKKSVSTPNLCQNISILKVLNSPEISNGHRFDEPIISALSSKSLKTKTNTDCHSKLSLLINTTANTHIVDVSKPAQKRTNDTNSGENKDPVYLLHERKNANACSTSFDKLSRLKGNSIEVQPITNNLSRDRDGNMPSSLIRKSTRRARVEVAVACLKASPIMTAEQSTPKFRPNMSSPYSNINFKSNERRPKNSRNISKLYRKRAVASTSSKKISKRKPPESTSASIPLSTRSSKRQSLAQAIKEDSEDPLTAHSPHFSNPHSGLFGSMAFAVSFVKNDKERKSVINLISENGGLLLEDGFDPLFEPFPHANPSLFDSGKLFLSELGKSLKFVSVIADDYSRKTKYIQALALGLPCISGRWIQCCITKNSIIDWSPYLLCAGQSSVLGNACRSRLLQPYSAAEAELSDTFAARNKIFEGKSVLLVMGKGKAQQKRKTFNFLARALGPARVGNVADIFEARKILADAQAQGQEWDLLHVHDHEKNVESDVFGTSRRLKSIGHEAWPDPRRVRIITDEIIIQSLIFGELIEE